MIKKIKIKLGLFFCEKMGWHKSPIMQGFDGASMTGICPRCQAYILQDSQGNWFALSQQQEEHDKKIKEKK